MSEVFIFEEISDEVEDGSVEDEFSMVNGLQAEGLCEVAFAQTGRADEKDVLGFFNKLAVGQLLEVLFWKGDIEVPVKVLEGSLFSEAGELGSALDEALLSHGQFILEDKFKELGMGEVVIPGFLESEIKGVEHSGESELTGLLGEVGIHGGDGFWS